MDTTGTSYESSVSSVGSFEGDEFRSESRDEVKEVHKLASKETKGVWRSKFLVVLSIVLTATLVSTGCYFVLQNEEHGNFVDSVSSNVGSDGRMHGMVGDVSRVTGVSIHCKRINRTQL
jgi:hypothetical protein